MNTLKKLREIQGCNPGELAQPQESPTRGTSILKTTTMTSTMPFRSVP